MTTLNAQLADLAGQLACRAPRDSLDRLAHSYLAVIFATSHTPAEARRILADWDGPAAIRDSAIERLDQLTPSQQEASP
jgi:hypothetical protein